MRKFSEFLTESMEVEPGTRLGSNPGGIHTDASGEKHYVKHYANPDQGRVEALAGKIYGHLGIKTLNPTHLGNGVVSTKWNPDLERIGPRHFEGLNHEQHHQLAKMYHGAVLTRNWDMVGLEHDNILRHKETGELHAIDHGGAFHFRARGKPKEYGPGIEEIHTLRHNNEASGHVFSQLDKHPDIERKALDSVRNMDDNHIHHLFKTSGLNNWEELHHSFQERKRRLLDHYDKGGTASNSKV